MPIQGIFKPDEVGYAEIFDEFTDCLKGVDMFSRLLLFYYFQAVTDEKMIHLLPFYRKSAPLRGVHWSSQGSGGLSKIKTMPVHAITLRALEKSLDIIS
jgi:hypothetical protein